MRRLIRIIRNILLLAIAVIVVLAGVLAFNTLTHGSRQLQVAAVPRAEVDAQAAAKRLAEAIRFRTISSYEKPDQHAEALRGMRAHIEKSFPAFHAAAKREIVGRYSLLYTWAGSDPRAQPIAFLAHQDVVPVAPGTEKDWQQPPFDGVICGRLHLGPRLLGRQGQPLFHAGGRRGDGQGRLPPQANDLFCVRP